MKIVGFAYKDAQTQLYIKPDVALLVNQKPFFLPAFSEQVEAHLCMLVRMSMMGRNIAQRFARRYYDSFTVGLNFIEQTAMLSGTIDGLTKSFAFDNSMAVGQYLPISEQHAPLLRFNIDENTVQLDDSQLILAVDEAVANASKYITLRQGDMISIDYALPAVQLTRNQLYEAFADDEQILRCRIK